MKIGFNIKLILIGMLLLISAGAFLSALEYYYEAENLKSSQKICESYKTQVRIGNYTAREEAKYELLELDKEYVGCIDLEFKQVHDMEDWNIP